MKWRIYYEAGDVWEDSDGPMQSAPKDGVQGILIAAGRFGKKRLLHSHDYYVERNDGYIYWCDDLGPTLRNVHEVQTILFGRWVNALDFEALKAKMVSDLNSA